MSRNTFAGLAELQGSCKDLIREELEDFVKVLGKVNAKVEEKFKEGVQEERKVFRDIERVEKEIEDRVKVLLGRKEMVKDLHGLLGC